jgi:hypothetical protein
MCSGSPVVDRGAAPQNQPVNSTVIPPRTTLSRTNADVEIVDFADSRDSKADQGIRDMLHAVLAPMLDSPFQPLDTEGSADERTGITAAQVNAAHFDSTELKKAVINFLPTLQQIGKQDPSNPWHQIHTQILAQMIDELETETDWWPTRVGDKLVIQKS